MNDVCRASPPFNATGDSRNPGLFCYADPPYPGQARKHYSHDPKCAEVDHRQLIESLCDGHEGLYGWALSTSSVALRDVLPLCPPEVRVGAWVKPFASFKPNVNPGYCWEPVIFWGGRRLGRDIPTVRDFVSCNITLKRGLSGAKPEGFCWWLFDMLGMQAGDELIDMFPGSGAVKRAWNSYQSERLVVA